MDLAAWFCVGLRMGPACHDVNGRVQVFLVSIRLTEVGVVNVLALGRSRLYGFSMLCFADAHETKNESLPKVCYSRRMAKSRAGVPCP